MRDFLSICELSEVFVMEVSHERTYEDCYTRQKDANPHESRVVLAITNQPREHNAYKS